MVQRVDPGSDPLSAGGERPALRIVTSEDYRPAPARRKRSRRSTFSRRLQSVLALAVVLATMIVAGMRLWQITAGKGPGAPMVVTMTVQPGESLWSLARRYGDPHKSILDRVDALSQANLLSDHSALVPGQRLKVPVENPVEIARLQRTVARGETRRQ